MAPIVSVREVSFRWPSDSEYLFSNLNLNFQQGSTVCLLGPNGAGKTTLIELILGWRRPDEGDILIDSRSVAVMPSRERGRSMALVPQDERLAFAYSVLEYVLLGCAPYLKPLARPGADQFNKAAAVLERLGIPHLRDRPLLQLSGGEKRLVLIARALLQQPRILLLDEPGNHLDPANRERIFSILRELRRSGITLIMSSHEPDIVSRLADSAVLLHRGESPEFGLTERMLVPENLAALYGVPVRIAYFENRRIILWGR